ncbi:hypothetical protein glysoja_050274 [Glycine soja]|uniref:Uncharacterized protein n=1 Tax=Glycine soja TaxID=3848 RepID=A0A0B2RH79_GLYSO|nr:hypothetical protein glysoja_050274 [Glycine soja]
MQVPLIDIDRINDLQVGLNSLQNPSFPIPSQITTSLAYNFCKWGAVILALVATFGSIINRVTIFIIRFRAKAPSLPSLTLNDDNFYTSSSSSDDDDDDNDDDLTYSSSEPEDEPSASSSFIRLDDYFRLRGTDNNNNNNLDDEFQTQNGTHKRCRSIGDIFSLSELANSKSVVKLWDTIGFGLGLDFDDYDGYDVGNAAWGPTVGKTLHVESGGVQKVYVRDDGRYSVTVGDMRKVSTPLESVTESDADTWWDADAIVVSDESFGEQQSMLQQPT